VEKRGKGTTLVEGAVLLLIGLISMTEGLRLTLRKAPNVLYDLLGPGLYVLMLGFGLTATGAAYLFSNFRKEASSPEKTPKSGEMKRKLIGTVLVYAVYTLLIPFLGYLTATVIFFILAFRIAGVRSWKVNLFLTGVVSTVSYIVFVHYCSVIFPHGMLF
jgi:hypothetical protein